MNTALTISQAIELALEYHQAGQLQPAEQIYRQILQQDPQQPEALQLLGMVAYDQGDYESAISLIRRAIAADSQQARFHHHLGMALQAQGRSLEAKLSYRQAIALQPDFFAAYHGLATVLIASQQFVEAENYFRQLLARRPTAEVYDNLGSILGMQGRFAEAENYYRQAIQLQSDWAEAYLHLGNAVGAQRRFAEAEDYYRQALTRSPSLVEAYSTLGKVLQAQGKLEEAITRYGQALTLQPENAGLQIKAALLMPVIMSSLPTILATRQTMAEQLNALLTQPPQLVDPVQADAWGNQFYRVYHGYNEREFQGQLAQLYRQAGPTLLYTAAHCDAPMNFPALSDPPRRLKIGFVSSAFLHEHVVTKFIAGVIANLSRDKFLVWVFSSAKSQTEISPLIQRSADYFEVLPLDLAVARAQIADRQLDILFYPDLGLDAFTYFLAFARLAPVQCTSWGHPVTTGIATIDYFISAKDLESSEAPTHYTEQLIQLNYLPCFYYKPALSLPLKSRQEFGLPAEVAIYLCPQSLFKLHPDFDDILAAILERDQTGQVVLVAGEQPYWTELLQQRLHQRLPSAVMPRLRVVPRQNLTDYLHLIATADVILEPLHFGGGITTLDALAVGTPLITLPSVFLRGRMAYYCYRQMGMMDCVVQSVPEYVELAVRLGTQADYRNALKAKILARHQVLYENPAVVRELEEFFEEIFGFQS